MIDELIAKLPLNNTGLYGEFFLLTRQYDGSWSAVFSQARNVGHWAERFDWFHGLGNTAEEAMTDLIKNWQSDTVARVGRLWTKEGDEYG